MKRHISPEVLPPTETASRRSETASATWSREGTIVLQPLAMRFPNRHGIYSPSKLEPTKELSYDEFLARYADYPRKVRVCFDEAPSSTTLRQNSELVTAYGVGLDCWYIVVSNGAKGTFSEE